VPLDLPLLLRLTGRLQLATTLRELLDAVREGVAQIVGYQNVWLAVIEPDSPRMVRILSSSGSAEQVIMSRAPQFPVDGDAMLEEIVGALAPVVVADARLDPRTDKRMVELLGNRTIVNVPLLLGGDRLGALGTGTFAPELPRPPDLDQLEMLAVLATHVAAALQRVWALERQREADQAHAELTARLHAVQRIEALALLAGGIAHDFNNLLTVVCSSLGLIGASPLSEEQRSDLKLALEAVERARAMTQHLLATGRQQALRPVPLDLHHQLRQLLVLMRRLIPQIIEIELQEGSSLPLVLGDPGKLDQVITNLCVNARDAMPAGGKLVLRTEPVILERPPRPGARPGRYVLLTVADTGMGMPAELLDRVFEPFFTTKGAGAGTGLGLSVALGIVEQHGGTMQVRSEVGAGTTFLVYLPVAERAPVAAASRPELPGPRGSERVLIAEDDAAVRELTMRILQRAGYVVDAVSNGEEAVAAAQTRSYDLYLLDVVMPKKTGRAVAEEVLALHPSARILLASGYSAESLPPAFMTERRVALLEKPYHPSGLLRAVRAALDA
jgi:two-component system cell cycle sensor histidine kinase/response regulator CckA